jgi:hypothetical protein
MDMNGKVTPVKGIKLQLPKMFKLICAINTATTPTTRVPW